MRLPPSACNQGDSRCGFARDATRASRRVRGATWRRGSGAPRDDGRPGVAGTAEARHRILVQAAASERAMERAAQRPGDAGDDHAAVM
eukprot:9051468-Pyramimonas_sp.AAC.1